MKKGILFLIILTALSGCSTKQEIVVEYKYIKQEIAILEVKKMNDLDKVELKVEDKKIVITEEEFKKLTSNIIILRSYSDYLKTLIDYYEKNVKVEKVNPQ